MVTHGNLWSAAVSDLYTIDLLSADRILLVAPLFHIAGLTVMTLTAFLKGAHLVLHRNFDPWEALQSIEKHRITAFGGVAAMLAPMINHPRFVETDITSLRILVTGGAPCPKPILEFFGARDVHVMQGYGLTESTGSATFLTSDFAAQKLGSVGKPDLTTEVRLVDGEGRVIDEPMRPGEILIRGPRIVLGYWRNPEATAATFDVDGWLRSGDVGYWDADGFLFISDRSKDMILSGGENIYSAEVESALFAHPAIAEVAVVALPDARWGEVPVAVIALVHGEELTLAELRAFAAERLARYKIPAQMLVVPSLPRNAAGKALKHQLRELARQEFASSETTD
jgi:fatty-acyl-CoA synthase